MNIQELERKQIAESGFANWPRDFRAEAEAMSRAGRNDTPELPNVRHLYPKVYDEYLGNERRYPVSDMWEREHEALANAEDAEYSEKESRD